MLLRLLKVIDRQLSSQPAAAEQLRGTKRKRINAIALEERILYSAAPMVDATAIEPSDIEAPSPETTESPEHDTENAEQLTFDLLPADTPETSREVVFIDAGVDDFEELLNDIAGAGHQGRDIEVVLLSAESDGVDQITDFLQHQSDVDAVHVISHGTAGQIQLGNTVLHNDNLSAYAGQLSRWADSLSEDADLLLYGCDLAKDEGRNVIEAIATLCECDVAASNDRTGTEGRAGDWDLEVQMGDINTEVVVSATTQASWQHILATYTVTNTNDTGAGSLRQAIADANNNGGADTIEFDISAPLTGGAHVITVNTNLPQITDTVTIDGTTDSDYSTSPVVQIASGTASANTGFTLSNGSQNSVLRGLSIVGFGNAAIDIFGASASGSQIVGNYIGLDVDGTTAIANNYGIFVQEPNTTIGGSTAADRNVISGNTQDGILLGSSGATGNVITGNYIGTNAAGTAAVGNGGDGIVLFGSVSTVTGNRIGGHLAGEGNVISGNDDGIVFEGGGVSGNFIYGNYIGTDATGLYAIGNTDDGIQIENDAHDNHIGDGGTGYGNVISGNDDDGVQVSDGAYNNLIQGNHIGIAADGSNHLRNGDVAVTLNEGVNNTLGGASSDEGNWIAGSRFSVFIGNDAEDITVQHNRIGTDLAGTANWGADRSHIFFHAPTTSPVNVSILDNVIAFGGQLGYADSNSGITLYSTIGGGHTLLRNVIYSSDGLAIDLNRDGVTANDAGDGDSGPNDLQNFPVLSAVQSVGGDTSISGTLNSAASTTYRVEFFSSPTGNASGHGEAAAYLGFTTVTTDGSGNASFGELLSGVSVTAGHVVSATATVDLGGGDYGSTSELSANVTASSNVIVVDTSSDTIDGDTSSMSALIGNKGADGYISLREALVAANNTANFNASTPDQIEFNISGGGIHTISVVGSSLPQITGMLVIDGTTQPTYVSAPRIQIDGGGSQGEGLRLFGGSGGSTIRGLSITNFTYTGITVSGSTGGSTIAGNYIGIGTDGSTAGGNQYGVRVFDQDVTIGGSTAADRNVISNNTLSGIEFTSSDTSGGLVVGNYIGTDATGSAAAGNHWGMSLIDGAQNVIVGGSTAAQRNIISANTSNGIHILDAATNNITVQGNWIGMGADGSTLIGNGGDGVFITAASDVTIGGDSAGEGNWIVDSGESGIDINAGAQRTIVQGNLIGTDAGGTLDLGNASRGVFMIGGADDSLIGGTTAGAANVIAFNTNEGVMMEPTTGTGNSILGNQIFSNGLMGIDLGGDGADTNDSGDGDSGANDLQNTPVITSAVTDGSSTTVAGTLNSTASGDFRIEFFSSPTAHASGHGDAAVFLGFVLVTTNGSGNASFSTSLAAVPAGHQVTATATRMVGADPQSTSEFAANMTVNQPATGTPTVTGTPSENETLTADTSGISDANGIASYTYQWTRDGVDISGATASTYTLGGADIGTQIAVRVGLTDNDGYNEGPLVSTSVGPIANINDAPVAVHDPGNNAALVIADDPATVGFWRLGEASGSTALDETASQNGTYSNVTLNQPGVSGYDTAAEFNGNDSQVDLGVIDVDGTGLTMAAWINADNFSQSDARIISKADGTSNSDHTWMLSTNDSGGDIRLRMRLEVNGVTNEFTATSGNLSASTWTHVAATYDEASREMILYVNGVQVGLTTHSQSGDITIDPTRSVAIGDNPGGARPFDGRIDEVFIMDRAMTAGELLAIYDGATDTYEVAEDGSLSVDAASGVLWNDMDADGDTLTAVLVSGPSNAASFTLNSDGSFDYTPDADFNGTDTFTYRADDGTDQSSIATASIIVNAVNDAPVFNNLDANPTFVEGGSPVVMDADATVVDAELSAADDFGGAVLTFQRSGGANSDDAFSTSGTVTTSGSNVLVGGNQVGTFTNAGGSLTVTFDSGATASDVNAILQTTRYENSSTTPPADVTIAWSFNDSNSGTQGSGGALTGSGSVTIDITAANDPPTGSVTISGTPTEDQTLTASNTLADADGMGTVSYQWRRDGVDISGVTGSTYTLDDADVGAAITVVASYTDGEGNSEAVTSAATSAVANVNDAPSGVPTISGTATEDQTLTADTSGISDDDGLGAFSYQWQRDGVDISGATGSTYTLGDADVGSNVRVVVSYTDGNGTAESVTSAATSAVTNINDAPTGVPTISGTAAEDETLTADTSGISDGDGLGTFNYQWQRDGADISGATGSTYTLGNEDVGSNVRVVVNYTDGNGTAESVTSAATSAVTNVNDPPSGMPTISGTATEDETLTADTSGISDGDGLGSFNYQWQRDGVDISGATGSTYTLGDDDVGSNVRVVVSYTDGNGTAESVTSAATSAVTNVNDTPSGVPTISGTATEDETLTADTSGISDADGLGAFSYQWQRDGVDISGATGSTYTLGNDDVGSNVRVVVSYTDGNGTAESITSAATSTVTNVNDPPTGVPTISGTATEDQTLTADTSGISDSDGLGTFNYQWQRDGVDISGATGSTYTLGDADVGSNVRVVVSYTDGNGTAESVTSAATSAVTNVSDAPSGVPTISGTAAEDETLTADTSGISDADGLGAFSYQWQRNGVDISGATGSTYTLDDADVGSNIRVVVNYTDGNGTAESVTSAATSAVTNVNDAPLGVPTISGTATEDETLTADTSGISDSDGLGTFNYQWQRDGVDISGATGSTYTLGDADVGTNVRVVVSYTDGNGTAESVTSAATSSVTNVNDPPTGVPTISGTATEDQTLTTDTSGISDNDGLGTFNYQWQRDGVDISGATGSTYTLDDGDVGSNVRVVVSYTDGNGTAESVTSAATSAVTNVNDAPSGVPIISGTATEDETLTADTSGISDGDGLGTFNYQWQRDGIDISGATGSTYTLSNDDVGSNIRVVVSYTDGNGTAESVTSVATSAVTNVNDAPTGVPTISGTATEDETLTADTSGIGDADGLGAFSYQWQRDGVDISGATGSTYTLSNDDVGSNVRVVVGYTDGNGTAESVTSAATSAVTNVNDAPSGVPTISGTAAEDETLTADTSGISDADGLGAFSYEWQRGGSNIAGATGLTYMLGDADVGSNIRVVVSYTDGNGTDESVTSEVTSAVTNVNDAPVGVPAITGTPTEDETLTVDTFGISDADGLGTFSYQWQRDGVNIGGAMNSTYTLSDADVESNIRVIVSYTDGNGTAESLTSASTSAVTNVNDTPGGVPSITGTTTEGETLTADTSSISDNDGLGTFSYQWLRDGVAISGANTATYTLTDSDVGTQISTQVTYTDGHGTAEGPLTSAQTSAITNVNDPPSGTPTITGTAAEDETLTADTSGISDNDGLGTFNYQWQRDEVDIVGATSSTYTLGDEDVGSNIRVVVSYTDGNGTDESVTSEGTSAVTNVNDAPVGVPAITGTATENETLTVDPSGISDADGLDTFNYQWQRDGVDIGGATASTYALGDADVGSNIRVVVSYTDENGTAESVTSAATSAVANINDAPTGVPAINGTPTENATLTADTSGISDDDGLSPFSYQWQRDGLDIGGATASAYTLGDSDVGSNIRIVVTYTDGNGSTESVTSAATSAVTNMNDAPTGVLLITGTPTENQTLTADTSNVSDADGLGPFSYQWQRNGSNITGATASTYTLGDTDVGSNIRALVSYTDGNGTAESLSSEATPAVGNLNDAPSGVPTITGTPTEDQVLTADTSAISDNDGLGTFTYQWLRNDLPITGATSASYTLTDADVGHPIAVQVSYTDGQGTSEGPLTSAATSTVANTNDAPTGTPTISGTAQEDNTLTVDTSAITDDDGLGSFQYQWQRDGIDIEGATSSSYTLGNPDVENNIRAVVTYLDGNGTPETLATEETTAIANVNDSPSGSPVIEGTPLENEFLTVDTSGISDDDGTGNFEFQWHRNGNPIEGATDQTYRLNDADVNSEISVQVSYTDGHGTTEGPLTSSSTASITNVNDSPTGTPGITGSATEDSILTADVSDLTDADGIDAIEYQWLRDGNPIAGETSSTYQPDDADVGSQITVEITYTDGHGTVEGPFVSPATAPVTNVDDLPTGTPSLSGSPVEDGTLTADLTGFADEDGINDIRYQWFADGKPIEGATDGSFTLGDDEVGKQVSYEVTYTDNYGNTNTSIASTATTSIANINDVPVARDDSYESTWSPILTASVEEGVLPNDFDIDGDALRATLITAPTTGHIELNADGSFLYTPNPGFHGDVTFTYVVDDGQATSQVAEVSISISGGTMAVQTPESPDHHQLSPGYVPKSPTVETTQAAETETQRPPATGPAADPEPFSAGGTSHQQVIGLELLPLDEANDVLERTLERDTSVDEFSSGTSQASRSTGTFRSTVAPMSQIELAEVELEDLQYVVDEMLAEHSKADNEFELLSTSVSYAVIGATVGLSAWLTSAAALTSLMASAVPITARLDPVYVLKHSGHPKSEDNESIADLIKQNHEESKEGNDDNIL